jgi:hypothetical protein
MSRLDKNETSNAIAEAIRAKRENRSSTATEIAQLEEALLADIESFDLDAAEQQARHQRTNYSAAGMLNSSLAFPEIAPTAQDFHQIKKPAKPVAPVIQPDSTGKTGFLDNLRHQAALRQQEEHSAMAERSSLNDSIDSALKKIFFFLHEMVQQVNIVKPLIPRRYALIEKFELQELEWQEGFADYRTQSQSAGALIELVTFTYQISASGSTLVERDGPMVERFRTLLFDYGLQFSCKEFRNERRYVEKAEFDIKPQISVSARWRADFAQGKIILETRNLERLGSIPYIIRPELLDQELLDAFGGLVLGQPNRFRELIRR